MDEGIKLSELLPERFEHLGEESRKELSNDPEISKMSLAWDYIESQLDAEIRDVLDGDVFELLGKSWAAAKELADYADPAKHPPGVRELLKFGDHDFKKVLHPTVDVTIGECPVCRLKFTLTLTGSFSGLYLGIRDGHVVDGRSGKAWASAQLSYAGVPLHKKKGTEKFKLPGSFKFSVPGIPIPRMV
jgi:hypothetical protein